MSELTFKTYSDLEISEGLTESSHVIIEENGDVKRFPANSIGKVKTVNGAEPDENGNVAVEIPAPVQPDLSQNDPEAPDYIKGKVFEAVALDLTFEFDSSEDNPNYLPELEWCLVTDKITDPSQINGASIVAGEYDAEIESTLVSNPVTVDGSGWDFIGDIYYEKSVRVYFPAANFSAGLLLAIMPKDTATPDGLSIVKAGLYVQNYNKSEFVRTFEQVLCTKPLDSKYISTTVPAISTAIVGQTIVVKAVDDTGKPTEWEAVDMPNGGSTVYYGSYPYIYNDASLQQKVSKSEFLAAVSKSQIYVVNTHDEYGIGTRHALMSWNDNDNYVNITSLNVDGASVTRDIWYTSEFVDDEGEG